MFNEGYILEKNGDEITVYNKKVELRNKVAEGLINISSGEVIFDICDGKSQEIYGFRPKQELMIKDGKIKIRQAGRDAEFEK